MWAALVTISLVGITMWGITEVVRIGTRTKENLERIRHGYPTLEGTTRMRKPASTDEGAYCVDMTRGSRDNN